MHKEFLEKFGVNHHTALVLAASTENIMVRQDSNGLVSFTDLLGRMLWQHRFSAEEVITTARLGAFRREILVACQNYVRHTLLPTGSERITAAEMRDGPYRKTCRPLLERIYFHLSDFARLNPRVSDRGCYTRVVIYPDEAEVYAATIEALQGDGYLVKTELADRSCSNDVLVIGWHKDAKPFSTNAEDVEALSS